MYPLDPTYRQCIRWILYLPDLLWADPATREQSASGLLEAKGKGKGAGLGGGGIGRGPDGNGSSGSGSSGSGSSGSSSSSGGISSSSSSSSSRSSRSSTSTSSGFLHAADPVLAACADRTLHPRWLAFGLAATKRFCKEHGITHVLRGHSVKVCSSSSSSSSMGSHMC
jgi:hypothetical protein